MEWQVEQHHASRYVTSEGFRSCYDSLDTNHCHCRGYEFDAGALVIAVLCYYRVHALRMNDGRIIYILLSVNASRRSMKYYICKLQRIRWYNALTCWLLREASISPVLVLTDWSWSENCCVRLSWQHQILFTLPQLILRVAAVVSKVLGVNFSDYQRMSRSTIFHDVTLSRIELHRFFKPDDLEVWKLFD